MNPRLNPKLNRRPAQPLLSLAPIGLLAILLGIVCSGPSLLYAGQGISAHLDSQGRVVFVNEEPPSPSRPANASRRVVASASATPKSDSTEPISAGEFLGESSTLGQGNLDALIEEAAGQHQIDPDLVRAIIQVESNYNPYAVSPRGARGLMQLIPATARRFGVRNLFDPRSNLDGGIRYLKYLMGMFEGDLQLSLAAYNAGEDAVARSRGVPPFRETQDYVRKITELYPLRSATHAISSVPRIEKYVDSQGVVHFSNTDMP